MTTWEVWVLPCSIVPDCFGRPGGGCCLQNYGLALSHEAALVPDAYPGREREIRITKPTKRHFRFDLSEFPFTFGIHLIYHCLLRLSHQLKKLNAASEEASLSQFIPNLSRPFSRFLSVGIKANLQTETSQTFLCALHVFI